MLLFSHSTVIKRLVKQDSNDWGCSGVGGEGNSIPAWKYVYFLPLAALVAKNPLISRQGFRFPEGTQPLTGNSFISIRSLRSRIKIHSFPVRGFVPSPPSPLPIPSPFSHVILTFFTNVVVWKMRTLFAVLLD